MGWFKELLMNLYLIDRSIADRVQKRPPQGREALEGPGRGICRNHGETGPHGGKKKGGRKREGNSLIK